MKRESNKYEEKRTERREKIKKKINLKEHTLKNHS